MVLNHLDIGVLYSVPWGLNFWTHDGDWKWEQHFRRWQCLLVGFWNYHPGDWQWRGRKGRKFQVIIEFLVFSHLCLFIHPRHSPSHPLCFNLFSSKTSFSGRRFGAEEDMFLVVYSTLHSTTCPELVNAF